MLDNKTTGWWQLKHFYFHSEIGEDSHFDEHIFQMGWFNHQPEKGKQQVIRKAFPIPASIGDFSWWFSSL